MTIIPITTFGVELRRSRERRALSQSKLAKLAGLDHSYVSRIEAGDRNPSKAAVLLLASAMRCEQAEQDGLLVAARYLPGEWEQLSDDVLRLNTVLTDDQLPLAYRQSVRDQIRALLVGAEAVRYRPRVPVGLAREAV